MLLGDCPCWQWLCCLALAAAQQHWPWICFYIITTNVHWLQVKVALEIEENNHSPNLSLICSGKGEMLNDGLMFVFILNFLSYSQNISVSDNKWKWGYCTWDPVEWFWWIAAVAKKACIYLTTAACMYHKEMESECLLVGSNILEKAMHVGGPGPKLHNVFQCDANNLDHLVSSNEPWQMP